MKNLFLAGGPLYASKYLKSLRRIYLESVPRVNGSGVIVR
jgi:hypothetical protein